MYYQNQQQTKIVGLMIILRNIEQIIHIPSVMEHLSLNIEMLNQSIMQMELRLVSKQYGGSIQGIYLKIFIFKKLGILNLLMELIWLRSYQNIMSIYLLQLMSQRECII